MSRMPKWQRELERADSQLRPWSRGLGRHLPVPFYVQRWLLLSSFDGADSYAPAGLASELLTLACLTTFKEAPLPPFRLVGGVSVEPPDKAPDLLDELKSRAGSGVCVFNGAFAWFFEADHTADRKRFLAWVSEAFTVSPSVRVGRVGWPVVVITTAHWPIDPRLLPGSPVSLPELAGPECIRRPARDVFAELGVPQPSLRLVSSDRGSLPRLEDTLDDDIPF